MADSKDREALKLVGQVISLSKPRTVRELVAIAHSKGPNVSEERVLNAIDALRDEGRINLSPPKFKNFGRFFMDSSWNTNFWVVILIVATTSLLFLLAHRFPWTLFEILPGVLLVFYLPGRSFLRAFLIGENSQFLERTALEIGSSIVIIMLLGLLLNFSGLGLYSAAALSFIIVFNVMLALLASYRDYSILQPR